MINAQSSEIFLSLQCKNFKELLFVYLLANPAETAYLSFQDRELSNDIRLVQVWRRKVVVHTFLGCPNPRLIRWPSCRNYRKPELFCHTLYPGEIAHSNSANRELFNDVRLMEVRRRKVKLHFTPVHTLCQLIEMGRSALRNVLWSGTQGWSARLISSSKAVCPFLVRNT